MNDIFYRKGNVMIGIIGAMDTEVAKLKELMTEVEVVEASSMEVYKGKRWSCAPGSVRSMRPAVRR